MLPEPQARKQKTQVVRPFCRTVAQYHQPGTEVSTNEDVGVLELLVYVAEVEDNTPPQLTLLGSSPLKVEVESVFSDPGATCVDDIDGVLNSCTSARIPTRTV